MKFFSNRYFPLLYTEKVKRPGSRYFLRGILLGDALAVFFAYGWFMQRPWLAALGIVVLQLSIWTIYELGYAENDRAAATFETNGHVPPNSADYLHLIRERAAWLYATAFSLMGVLLMTLADLPAGSQDERLGHEIWVAIRSFVHWMAFLVVGRAVYFVYNRIEGRARLLLYPILQLFRFGGYSLIATTNVVGAFLISAFILARWVPYVLWRIAKIRWHERNKLLVLAWFLFTLPLGYSVEPTAYLSLHCLAIVSWLALRSAKEIARESALMRAVPSAA